MAGLAWPALWWALVQAGALEGAGATVMLVGGLVVTLLLAFTLLRWVRQLGMTWQELGRAVLLQVERQGTGALALVGIYALVRVMIG